MTTTPPDVAVFDGDTRLGQTPFEVNANTIAKETSGGYLLRLQRDGYRRVWLWIPSSLDRTQLTINLQPFFIDEKPRAAGKSFSRAEMDTISAKLLALQTSLLLGGEVPEEDLSALVKSYPRLGSTKYIQGIAALRASDTEQAKARIREALELSPGERDYVILYKELGGDPVIDTADPIGGEQSNPSKDSLSPEDGD